MVSIRLQRTGRRRHAQFRVVVQDSRRAPTSGRVVANLGFYNPHTKEHGVDLEKAAVYLRNGAQPSERMVRFFVDNKVDLPAWVKPPRQKSGSVRHPDKLRRNRPQEEEGAAAAAPEPETGPAEAKSEEEPDEPEKAAALDETARAEEEEDAPGGDGDKPQPAAEEEAEQEDGGGDEPQEGETGKEPEAA